MAVQNRRPWMRLTNKVIQVTRQEAAKIQRWTRDPRYHHVAVYPPTAAFAPDNFAGIAMPDTHHPMQMVRCKCITCAPDCAYNETTDMIDPVNVPVDVIQALNRVGKWPNRGLGPRQLNASDNRRQQMALVRQAVQMNVPMEWMDAMEPHYIAYLFNELNAAIIEGERRYWSLPLRDRSRVLIRFDPPLQSVATGIARSLMAPAMPSVSFIAELARQSRIADVEELTAKKEKGDNSDEDD